MNRAKLALSLSVSGIALVAFVYGTSFRHSPDTVNSPSNEVVQPYKAASDGTKPDASEEVMTEPAEDDSQKGDDDEGLAVKDASRRIDDEATANKQVREETTREVKEDYSLLLERLGLSSNEIEALLEFLIEDAIARTKTPYSDGIGMPEHERSARIAEIIGDDKLQQLLAFERSLGEFREVQRMQAMLELNDTPLTDTQRDRLLKILIDTREQVDMKRPAHMKPNTFESLEHTLNQLDEYERLVLELASSVLSAKQVEYVFERYQARSYMRADVLESQKQRRAENPDDDMPLGYPSSRN